MWEKFGKYFNLNELIFDLAIILYTKFVLYRLISGGQPLISYLTPLSAIIIAFIIDIFVPWFSGSVYGRYKRYASKIIKKVIIYIFGIIILFLFIQLPVNLYNYKIVSGKHMMILFIGGIFAIMLGGFLGLKDADRDADRDRDTEAKEIDFAPDEPSLLEYIIMIPFLIGWIWVSLEIGEKYTGAFLGILIWLVGTVLIPLSFMGIHKVIANFLNFLIEKKIYPYLYLTIRNILFPFIVATIMSIWSEIYILPDKKSGFDYLIFVLILNGFIPLRILLLFVPPLRVSNLIFGGISFYYFIYTLKMC